MEQLQFLLTFLRGNLIVCYSHLDSVHDFAGVVFDPELLVPLFSVSLGEIWMRLEFGDEVVEVSRVVAARYVTLL